MKKLPGHTLLVQAIVLTADLAIFNPVTALGGAIELAPQPNISDSPSLAPVSFPQSLAQIASPQEGNFVNAIDSDLLKKQLDNNEPKIEATVGRESCTPALAGYELQDSEAIDSQAARAECDEMAELYGIPAILPRRRFAIANNGAMEQVNSVFQLSDVQPTDWAYSALQGLADRYGCLLAYPDGTYRGDRAITRYEFAAGLEACMSAIQNQIESAGAEIASADLEQLGRLQEEFAVELATLRARVDGLEVRAAELEATQFSTTTKLTGEVSIALSHALGEDIDEQPIFDQRVRLVFNTSFTGTDLFITYLQVGEAEGFDLTGETGEGLLANQVFGDTDNEAALALGYIFPIGDKFVFTVVSNSTLSSFFIPTINPFIDDLDAGTTSVSTFAQHNPIYRFGGGASFSVDYKMSDSLLLSAGYLAGEAELLVPGGGLFNGDYSALGQIRWTPTDGFALGITYLNSYFESGNFAYGFGTDESLVGTDVANTLNGLRDDYPVIANSYGIEASWEINPKFALSGWLGFTKARLIGLGDADVWTYAVSFIFPDLGKIGNLGGIVLGAQPTLRSLDIPGSQSFSRDWAYHVEGFYKFQANDNISITPGFIWVPAPNQDKNNSDIFIGTLRTTFTF